MRTPRESSFWRENGLSLFFGLLFLVALVGQALTGWALFNEQQVTDGLAKISLARYLSSSSFGVDVAENWQSEYLQFLLYVWLTVWFVQRGSPESKELGKEGTESDEEQKVGKHADSRSPRWSATGGLRTLVYSNSLAATMGAIFVGSWLAQSVAGVAAFNEEQINQLQDPIRWSQYVFSADFWNRTLQNWQSEFLAVGSFAILAVFLRQRGSPESKPVGEPHEKTGVTG
ncbi:MAG: hypothetical protein QOE19_3925 [Actinomycetota bacterium]|nr:hypothetical protein [Actinomycetota bacterium]MDQ1669717.1 hypothetical protein [Actinomycetota bacterium]